MSLSLHFTHCVQEMHKQPAVSHLSNDKHLGYIREKCSTASHDVGAKYDKVPYMRFSVTSDGRVQCHNPNKENQAPEPKKVLALHKNKEDM